MWCKSHLLSRSKPRSDSSEPNRLRSWLYGYSVNVHFFIAGSSLTPGQIFSVGVPNSYTSKHINHLGLSGSHSLAMGISHITTSLPVFFLYSPWRTFWDNQHRLLQTGCHCDQTDNIKWNSINQSSMSVFTDKIFTLTAAKFPDTFRFSRQVVTLYNSCMSASGRSWKRSHHLEDAVELVDLRLAGEERLLHEELGEDAADRPHVDGRTVLLGTKQQLRCTVPQRHDDRRVVAQRRAILTRQAKVTDLHSNRWYR